MVYAGIYTRFPLCGGKVGPRAGLGVLEERKICCAYRHSSTQHRPADHVRTRSSPLQPGQRDRDLTPGRYRRFLPLA